MDDRSSALSKEQEAFLRDHTIAVLATGRRDGSPQVSHVVYDYDGRDLVISVKSYTAKWKNTARQPRVALLVHDGRKQLIIYGRAERVSEDPARIDLTARVFARITGKPDFPVTDDFVANMDAQQRTVLRVIPENAAMND
jgi:PPOX class probable F420-dependent enzyme